MIYRFSWMIIICTTGYSQTTISGTLIDEAGNPVGGASVVINKAGTDEIIAYDISDGLGMYSITFTFNENEVDIQVRCVGFGMITETIPNQAQTKSFELLEEVTKLKEIIVKTPPITQAGDTISYAVNSFVKEHDRSIADVLKRMPGIDVRSDGQILYQGNPINKYYIEGLDLLGGKYNLANENLPHNEVTQVQVLENHQPVKVLDSVQFSDEAALNIKLKNKYTFTGQARIGLGFSPLIWNANITPLLFTRKQQMLTSYQANNIGQNVASQLKTLTLEDALEQFENNSEKQDWLGIQKLRTPSFSEKRWLDNNIHLISANYLQKLKKDYELRTNVFYLNDYQQQNGFTNTLSFTPSDTISLLESKFNQLYFNSLEANLAFQKNTDKNYLKNSTQFQGSWDSQRGNIQLNTEPVIQNLSNRYFKFYNKLKTVFPLGKQLMTLNSYLGFNKTPQTLQVNPGQFDELLNNGNTYNEVFQDIDLQTFYTNNSIGLTRSWKQFNFSPNVGFQFEKQHLQSQITASENQSLHDEFSNDLDWTRSKLYFNLQTQYKKTNGG